MQRYIKRVPVRQLTIGTADGTGASLEDTSVEVHASSASPSGAVIDLGDGTEIPCLVPAGADLSEGAWDVTHIGVICDSDDNAIGLMAAPPVDDDDDSGVYDDEGQGDIREVLIMAPGDAADIQDIGWSDADSSGYFWEVLPDGRLTRDRDVESRDRWALLIVDDEVELRLQADGVACGRYDDGDLGRTDSSALSGSICPFAELIVGSNGLGAQRTTVKLMPGESEDDDPFLAVHKDLHVPVKLPEGIEIPEDGIDCTGVIVLHDEVGNPTGVMPVSVPLPALTVAHGSDEVESGPETGVVLILRPADGVASAAYADDNSDGGYYAVDADGDFARDDDDSTEGAALLLLCDDTALTLEADGSHAGDLRWQDSVLHLKAAEADDAADGESTEDEETEAVGEV